MKKIIKITGTVVRGVQKGRTLGFPTANVAVDITLDSAIYAGYITIDENKYRAALYSPGNKIIEAFILDFSDDLYGKKVNIEIVKKIRDKKNFKDEKEAIDQITKDVLKVKKILR